MLTDSPEGSASRSLEAVGVQAIVTDPQSAQLREHAAILPTRRLNDLNSSDYADSITL